MLKVYKTINNGLKFLNEPLVTSQRYIKHKGNADDVYLTRDGKTIPFSEIEGDFEL